jgi:hypothetical protein
MVEDSRVQEQLVPAYPGQTVSGLGQPEKTEPHELLIMLLTLMRFPKISYLGLYLEFKGRGNAF